MKYYFLTLLILLGAFAVKANMNINPNQNIEIKDYGVHGHLFDIEEISIVKEIMEKLQLASKEGKLKELENAFKEKVKKKILRPNAVAGITKAKQNRSWTYSTVYTQKSDITDGNGGLIVKAGTTVNALDKASWGESLIFIDSADIEQINWVKNIPGKIVLTNGSPLEITKQLNRQVYFDQGGILCHKFKIEAVPALVQQDGKSLRVSEVKL